MSTIKSSAENLTLNADGANNDIKFQSNGSEVASIDQAGLLTATTFAGSGASLTALPAAQVSGTHTNFTSTGIDDNADATAITIDASENVGIGTTAPLRQLHISNTSANPEIAFTSGTSGAASLLFGDGLTGTDVYKGYVQYQHNGDYMLIATGATTRLRVDSDGLKFNADTAAANALDDYEEGTWTPTSVSNFGTFTQVVGKYTKIGNLVYVKCYFEFTGAGTTNARTVGGLPFAPRDDFPNSSVEGQIQYWGDNLGRGFASQNSTIVLDVSGKFTGTSVSGSSFRMHGCYLT